MKTPSARLALFASGNGSNVQRICDYFRENSRIQPVVLVCDRLSAPVLERAARLGLPALCIDRERLGDPSFLLHALRAHKVSHIVLAGFLALVPPFVLAEYPVLNLHPSLLPAFGGKGMYGNRVHRAVLASGCPKSGITIHEANERYDEGKVIFQAECEVLPQDSEQTLAERIHRLEHRYFPEVIEDWVVRFGDAVQHI
ncbi:MAG: phosphoribosylglycinamide formyltransferase [Bacteroidales bacterium]|nr:phosphoribosylglycinamide formyltransferase [Bacteroidales bacterium]